MFLGPLLFVYTSSPKDNEMILSGYKFIHKGLLYKFFHPWLATGLLTSTGEKWRTRRKALTPAFHFKIIDQFVPVFNSCSDVFVQQMRARVGAKGFDVWEDVKLLTLDVICETAMGFKINAQIDSNSEYVTALNELLALTVLRMMKPWLFFDWIYWLTPSGRQYKKCLPILHNTTDRMIRERRKELLLLEKEGGTLDADELGRRRRLVFLDLLILMARDGSLSDMDIREEVDTFLFEGHDTTSSGIAFAIFLLSKHPDVQEKIYEELESIFDTSKPISPTISELSELKYLEMVIKESLRLYPPVIMILRSIQQEVVLPESQRFAMLEMKNVLAKLVWNFRVLPEPGFEPSLVWEVILKSQNGLFVRLEERQRESK
ncbi:Cytochrome P450 4C1 [Gryllus bimaculatus]|nr:Cytochrome P450 4C1 [Gryllus bimaculatus]